MNIALLNEKVEFEKQVVTVDKVGNHINSWESYLVCHATISGEGGDEVVAAGQLIDHTDMNVTIRYSKKASVITNTGYRIVFQGQLYDIKSVDHMSYRKKVLKFKCKRVER